MRLHWSAYLVSEIINFVNHPNLTVVDSFSHLPTSTFKPFGYIFLEPCKQNKPLVWKYISEQSISLHWMIQFNFLSLGETNWFAVYILTYWDLSYPKFWPFFSVFTHFIRTFKVGNFSCFRRIFGREVF